jgi:hypothetical protein
VQNISRKLKHFSSFIFEFVFGTSQSTMTDVRIRARAWVLDAVIEVASHPHLLIVNGDETEISHQYVEKMLKQCESYGVNTLNTMRGLDLISFSIPKLRSSLLYKNSVPLMAILHGKHNISQQTVHEMFCRIQGFYLASTPLYFGPGTMYKTFREHAMYR